MARKRFPGFFFRRGAKNRMDAELVKEEIINHADHLFKNYGYERTGMRDIAKESGISLGKLQYHFPQKKLIMEEIYNRRIKKYFLQLDRFPHADEKAIIGIMSSEYEFIARALSNEGSKDSYIATLGNEEICRVYVNKSTQLLMEKNVFPQSRQVDVFFANIMMYGGLHQMLQFYYGRSAEFSLGELVFPLFKSRLLFLGSRVTDEEIQKAIDYGTELAKSSGQ